MPAPKVKPIQINLLPKDGFTASPIGRLLNWSLSTGRYIVVFTELIVILTFLSRFTLDRQVTDLNESILQKQALLSSYQNIEQIVTQVQAKTEFLIEKEDRIQTVDLLDFLSSRAPEDIIFEQLEVRTNRFALIGTSFSQSSLQAFINILKSESSFTDVILDNVNTSEQDTGINFTLRANFNDN